MTRRRLLNIADQKEMISSKLLLLLLLTSAAAAHVIGAARCQTLLCLSFVSCRSINIFTTILDDSWFKSPCFIAS